MTAERENHTIAARPAGHPLWRWEAAYAPAREAFYRAQAAVFERPSGKRQRRAVFRLRKWEHVEANIWRLKG